VDHASLVAAVESEAGALTFALEGGEMDDIVPTCPGWEVRDLAVHMGQFCGRWSQVLGEATAQATPPLPDPPGDDALVPWVTYALATLVDQLAAAPPATPVRPWFGDARSAAFVARRSAHELAVHRYDAQAARGICTPIPTELAADGSNRVLSLRSAELGTEWAVTLGEDGVEVERRTQDQPPAEGSDLIVSGTTSDLELTIYHRPTLSPVDVHGDYTVLDEWHQRFSF
jgi:uncharacterized protein (TIGR03083 family)